MLHLLLLTRYDVWLVDWRVSCNLPSMARRDYTLDDCAAYDYPAAINKVIEVTKQVPTPYPVGGDSHIKRTRVLVICRHVFKCLSPLRGTLILFSGCDLKSFSPLRETKILFSGCGLNWVSPLIGTKILFCGCGLKCFFTPKRY